MNYLSYVLHKISVSIAPCLHLITFPKGYNGTMFKILVNLKKPGAKGIVLKKNIKFILEQFICPYVLVIAIVVLLLTSEDIKISKDKCPIRNKKNVLPLRHLFFF